jgi:DNA-binding NarL/FixJ family response regulator
MFSSEDQMKPKTKGSLTAQLRIFALMRLGIKNNETIASILQYTVNTVYTYRFRAKSKALVPAEDFEQRIMGIQVAAD